MGANYVTLSGSMVRDPEVRKTNSGTDVANFSIAVNKVVRNENGYDTVLDGFFDCVAWRKQAKIVEAHGSKGTLVYVIGRLQQNKWENAEGESRSKVEVVAQEVGFHLPPPDDDNTDGQKQGQDENVPF